MKNKLASLFYIFNTHIKGLHLKNYLQISKFFLNKYICKLQIPVSTTFLLTYRCQCNCNFCYLGNIKDNSDGEIDTKTAMEIIKKIAVIGCINITFAGGEPLLRKDLVELVRFSNSLGLRTSIDTNGLLLTTEFIRKLKKAGIGNINISLDSHDPVIHDRLRGLDGCFYRAIKAIRNCNDEGVTCITSTFVSKILLTDNNLERIINLNIKTGAKGCKLLLPRLFGNLDGKNEFLLTRTDRNKIKSLLDYNFVFLESPFELEEELEDQFFCPSLKHDILTITPQGYLQFCPVLTIRFGDLKSGDILNLLQQMWRTEIFAKKYKGCIVNNQEFKNKFSHLVANR